MPLMTPQALAAELPLPSAIQTKIAGFREQVQTILNRQDDRLIVVVGPCSIHDELAALEYAQRLAAQTERFSGTLRLVMRVYFQKPRTLLGWKGLIHDPHLDESFDILNGLRIARRLLLKINQLLVPTGSEFLDLIIPQYLADLTTWSAIGARTTESQIHRQLASGLPTAVGFKNSQSGDVQVAVNAVYAAGHPQHYLSIAENGNAAVIATSGNQFAHIILRGGHLGPNYDEAAIHAAAQQLTAKQLTANIMVDCSHGNSEKDHLRQISVAESLATQIAAGNPNIIGVMLESHLVGGKQKLITQKPLNYGQSITDACLSWDDSVEVLEMLSAAVLARRKLDKSFGKSI